MVEKVYDIDENPVDYDTVVCGVVCLKCGKTLPPHTIRRHLDTNDPIHKCPHDRRENGCLYKIDYKDIMEN